MVVIIIVIEMLLVSGRLLDVVCQIKFRINFLNFYSYFMKNEKDNR